MVKCGYKQETLTLEKRINVIKDSEKGLSQRKLAEKYKCGKTQVQKIIKDKESIQQKWSTNANKDMKRDTYQPYKEINDLTYTWFKSAKLKGVFVTGTLLQEKARSFARALQCKNFAASNGWLHRFCTRNKIMLASLSADGIINKNSTGSITTGKSGPPIINLPHNHVPDLHAVAIARCRNFEEGPPDCQIDVPSLVDPDLLTPKEEPADEKQTTSSATSPAPSSSKSFKSILKPRNSGTPKFPSAAISKSALTPPTESEAEVCLRWNSHHSNMQTAFPDLMSQEQYVDVTLAAEGKVIKCHRLILSSCSSYFDEMLKTVYPMQHPIIFLRDFEFWQVRALVDFMYKGEVNVDQNKLESLLQAAEILQVKGLAGKGPKKDEEIVESNVNVPETYMDESFDELQPDSPPFVFNPGDEDEFKPYYYYKKKLKKNKKKKVPVISYRQVKTIPINLKGTKSRPVIKQPRYYDPDFPDHTSSRSVSPPKIDSDPVFHIDNIKIEPIDIDMPTSPACFDMNNQIENRTPDTNEANISDEAYGHKLPLFVQLKSGKELEFGEPPPKKAARSILKPLKVRNQDASSEEYREAPVIIEKITQNKQSNIEKLDDVPITIEKISTNESEDFNKSISIEALGSKEAPENEAQPTENKKKFCIRVVKLPLQPNTENDDKSGNEKNKSSDKILELNESKIKIVKVKSTADKAKVTDTALKINIKKVSEINSEPSTSTKSDELTEKPYFKIKIPTLAEKQRISKKQLTAALKLKENMSGSESPSLHKKLPTVIKIKTHNKTEKELNLIHKKIECASKKVEKDDKLSKKSSVDENEDVQVD